jgi:DNA helicase IV
VDAIPQYHRCQNRPAFADLTTMSTEHPEFPLEQQHINRAVAALQTMQETERAKARRAGVGGSMRMAERALRELAESRLERLLDAEAGVCFGRIYAEDDRDWHIGLQHIKEGEETLVISFETEIGGKFAAATAEDPQGLRSRRRLAVADGTRLVSVRDEMLDGSDPRPGYTDDAILEALEADRSGEMRHIAATIERHQNRLIRFDRSGVLVVQGGPGTGKTVVALHRASWLAFTFAGSLGDTGGILVVGPNPTFMSYIQSVLPGLGKRHIAQMDVERLAPVRGRSREAPEIATLKGDARMARVLRQAAFSRVQPLTRTRSFVSAPGRFHCRPMRLQRRSAALVEGGALTWMAARTSAGGRESCWSRACALRLTRTRLVRCSASSPAHGSTLFSASGRP